MTKPLTLSPDQAAAFDAVEDWLAGPRRTLTLGGYAGTGKTTLVSALLRRHPASVCAFTGKAAFVLQSKGVPATTMHRLIYRPVDDGRGGVTFVRVEELPTKLVVVDEASMVDLVLKRDLESFGGKVLYVGDHGQLEPVGDDPGLMADPDVRLEQIHRQAAGSPIIQFAHHVREGHLPRDFDASNSGMDELDVPGTTSTRRLSILSRAPTSLLLEHDVVLCGFNRTRADVNRRMRGQLGFSGPEPLEGERVVCLRNHRDYGVFNGMQGTVKEVRRDGDRLYLIVEDDTGTRSPEMLSDPDQFGSTSTLKDTPYHIALWDWGYALTVHKSQGSEWPSVLVLEQVASSWSASRWRYTAATRAAEHLTYVQKVKRA